MVPTLSLLSVIFTLQKLKNTKKEFLNTNKRKKTYYIVEPKLNLKMRYNC